MACVLPCSWPLLIAVSISCHECFAPLNAQSFYLVMVSVSLNKQLTILHEHVVNHTILDKNIEQWFTD